MYEASPVGPGISLGDHLNVLMMFSEEELSVSGNPAGSPLVQT
jgi:hypothetical protein